MTHTRFFSLAGSVALLLPLVASAYTPDTFKNILYPAAASSSSVSSRSLAPEAVFNRQRARDIATSSAESTQMFVPFLKRFITLPAGWKGVLLKDGEADVVTFTHNSNGGKISIRLFNYKECDKNSIEASRTKMWKDAGKPVEGTIGIARAYGAQGLGLTWLEPSSTSTVRQFCVIPAGQVLSAKVTVSADDQVTAELVERQLLAQLWRSDRFGRRR